MVEDPAGRENPGWIAVTNERDLRNTRGGRPLSDPATATATFADVFSRNIVSYTDSSSRFIVKSTTKKTTRQLQVTKSVRVSLGGNARSLYRVKSDQSVSVFASSSNVMLRIVRSPKFGSSTTSKPKTTWPTTARTTTTPSRTTPCRATGPSTKDTTSSASPSPSYPDRNATISRRTKGLLTSWSSIGSIGGDESVIMNPPQFESLPCSPARLKSPFSLRASLPSRHRLGRKWTTSGRSNRSSLSTASRAMRL